MGSDLFIRFMQKRAGNLRKQQPPGPPPRPGLAWKPETHRWIRPENSDEEYDHRGNEVEPEHTLAGVQRGRSMLAGHFLEQLPALKEEIDQTMYDSESVEEHLNGLAEGKKWSLSRLSDAVEDVFTGGGISESKLPRLVDLSRAIQSTAEEEHWSGLSEEHIHGGHDGAKSTGRKTFSGGPGWGGTPDHPFHYD